MHELVLWVLGFMPSRAVITLLSLSALSLLNTFVLGIRVVIICLWCAGEGEQDERVLGLLDSSILLQANVALPNSILKEFHSLSQARSRVQCLQK